MPLLLCTSLSLLDCKEHIKLIARKLLHCHVDKMMMQYYIM